MHRLPKLSGVPKANVIDICSSHSDIKKRSGKPFHLLVISLGCTMEAVMHLKPSVTLRKPFMRFFQHRSTANQPNFL